MRISLYRDLGVKRVYTIESSFCGALHGRYGRVHFTTEMLEEMGRDIGRALLVTRQGRASSIRPTLPPIRQTQAASSVQRLGSDEMTAVTP
jgi:hypothetical protein